MSLLSADELMQQRTLDAPMVPPSEMVPDRPDPTVLNLLHRNHDGYVSFTSKRCDVWRELGNIKASELTGLFGNQLFQEAVDQDAYYSVHGMFNHDNRRKKDTHPLLAPSLRNIKSLRWLTSCHVDLDCYSKRMDKHDAYAAVMRLVEAGKIPAPSVFSLSRGVWAIWILRDRLHPEEPVRCYPHEKVYDWWSSIQDALHLACLEIGSDPSTRHGATVTRIPGSISTKAGGHRVGYMIPADINGNLFTYTLEELDNLVRPSTKKQVVVQGRIGDANPNKQRGYIGRWDTVLQRLKRLKDYRRGWKVGTRNMAILFVATALKGRGATTAEAMPILRYHLDGMEQPVGDSYRASDAMGVWIKADRSNPPSNQTIADALNVTPDEAAILNSIPTRTPFPPARIHQGILPLNLKKATRQQRQEQRRSRIQELWDIQVGGGYGAPSATHMKELLDGEGIDGTVKTIMSDLRAMGLVEERTPPAEPKADQQLRLLK